VAPPVSGLSPCGSRPPPHPLGCIHRPLHPFPCGTMGALSPCPSQGLGDPEVHAFPWSVRRSVIGRLARSLRVLLEGAFARTYPMPLQLQAQVIAPSSCGRSSTTSRLTFAPFGLTLYGLACTASWERVLPALRCRIGGQRVTLTARFQPPSSEPTMHLSMQLALQDSFALSCRSLLAHPSQLQCPERVPAALHPVCGLPTLLGGS